MGRSPMSERTVKGGTWHNLMCDKCGLREDLFVPLRKNSRSDVVE